jgi:hypothetical protein
MTNPTESLPNEPAPVKAWPAGRIAAAVSTVLWLFMALIGISESKGFATNMCQATQTTDSFDSTSSYP